MTSAINVFVVDDDEAVRDSVQALLESAGYAVTTFESARAFLDRYQPGGAACLIADIRMPGMDGLALQEELIRRKIELPVIFVTGHGDVPLAVRAMKLGSIDFIEKPYAESVLMNGVERAAALSASRASAGADRRLAEERIAALTSRELDVMRQMVAGRPNKIIAFKLDISPRTVEVHRARIMEKMQIRSLSELVRLALAAGIEPASD
jgi:two-component system response regulator FixJ